MLKLDMVDELFIHLTLKLLQFIEKKIVWVNSGTGMIDQDFVFLEFAFFLTSLGGFRRIE